jgi:hypothetical protein
MSRKFRYKYDAIDEGIGVIHERFIKAEYIDSLDKHYTLKKVLEVGSGISAELAAGVGFDSLLFTIKGKYVVLIDHTNENLQTAKKVYEFIGLKDKIHLVQAYPSKMPFRPNTFDLVFSSYLVEFINNPIICLREMKRVSQLVLLFATNYLNVGHFIQKIYGGIIRAPWKRGSKYQTTLWTLRKSAEAAGLKIIESGALDIPPWPSGVAIMKPKGYEYLRKLRIMNRETSPWTFRLLRLFYLFEKALPTSIKTLQSHIVYTLAFKQSATH